MFSRSSRLAERGEPYDNEGVVILEAAILFGMVGVLVYATIRVLTGPPATPGLASRAGVWHTAHYDLKGETWVVVQKTSPNRLELLDEHVVATFRVDDPEYDVKFLTAMSTARERQALFEAEEEH